MAITLLQPFNLDTSGNYTFTTVTANIKTDSILYANGSPYVFTSSPGGSNTQVQFNDANSFGGNSNFTFDKTTSILTITGNIIANNANLGNLVTANFFTGSGNNLSNIQAANITGQVANALVAGTVYTAAQPNITSVGTLSSLSVSGNANIGNIGTAGIISATGNITGGNISATNYIGTTVSITGNITSANANLGNLATANFFTGTLTTAAQPNITSTGTLTSLSVSGNANIGNINTATISASGNVTANNVTVANVLTVSSITTSGLGGNISGADYITANFFVGSGNNLSNIQASNITGQVANALVAGTVYTAAQPNITSVGTLTSLSVSGNANIGNINTEIISASGNVTGANILTAGTVSATGNITANYFIGNGSLLTGIATGTPSSIANGNSNVNIDTANGNVTISAVGNANIVVITGTGANINGYANVTGNLAVNGNIAFTGANVSLGNVSNLKITGGTANYVLTTDGTGNLLWANVPAANMTVDTFTANGVANSFTLSTSPISDAYILININGVFQFRDSYEVAGNVLTLGSTPSNGSLIEVSTMNLGSAGGSGGGSNISSVYTMGLLFGG
jgi:hypothetical protein